MISGGLGLGLAIVKHLVELHGGSTYATSAGEGKGSTFSVHLPIAIIHQDPLGSLGSTEVNLGQVCDNVDLSNVRVLIVDDDSDAREMLRHVFQEYGATVELAASAMEALERLNEAVHDIIISDIGMPDMDGYQLLRRVRSLDAKITAVAVTAFADSETERALSSRLQYACCQADRATGTHKSSSSFTRAQLDDPVLPDPVKP